jgi:molecular chaperone GrpE
MTENESWMNRAKSLFAKPGDGRGAMDGDGALKRLATLEMDLRDRETEIDRLRREYALLQSRQGKPQNGAATRGVEELVRKLAPILSQLATMQALTEEGREITAKDVLKLCARLEQVLEGAGLARVGQVGSDEPFDTRLHERMSGAGMNDRDPVTIRFVGYRLGETVLLKAMVSRRDPSAA